MLRRSWRLPATPFFRTLSLSHSLHYPCPSNPLLLSGDDHLIVVTSPSACRYTGFLALPRNSAACDRHVSRPAKISPHPPNHPHLYPHDPSVPCCIIPFLPALSRSPPPASGPHFSDCHSSRHRIASHVHHRRRPFTPLLPEGLEALHSPQEGPHPRCRYTHRKQPPTTLSVPSQAPPASAADPSPRRRAARLARFPLALVL